MTKDNSEANLERIRTARLANRERRGLLRLRCREPAVSGSVARRPDGQDPAESQSFLGPFSTVCPKSLAPKPCRASHPEHVAAREGSQVDGHVCRSAVGAIIGDHHVFPNFRATWSSCPSLWSAQLDCSPLVSTSFHPGAATGHPRMSVAPDTVRRPTPRRTAIATSCTVTAARKSRSTPGSVSTWSSGTPTCFLE